MGFDGHQAITDQVMAALDKGVVPWHKPWNVSAGRPRNMETRNAYRGSNVLMLAITAMARGYGSPWWGTVKQINKLGGHVKAGQNRKNGQGGTMIVFWKISDREVETSNGPETKRSIYSQYSNVFNAEQCEGLPERFYPKPGDTPEFAELPEPQAVLDAYLPQLAGGVVHNQADGAHYIPSLDRMELPPREAFKTVAAYYYTAFHESTHSTGHTSRLSRDGVTQGTYHGSGLYAFEELVAEMGSAFLLASTGVEEDKRLERSADYIRGWLTALGNDRKLVGQAASAAEKAVALVLEASAPAVSEQQPEAVAA